MNNVSKVCILTSAHSARDVRIFHKEAKALFNAGYKITLIAQHENDISMEGIDIIALPRPKNRFNRMILTTWKIFRIAKKQKADVYHFHDPELIPAGLLLSITGNIVIYDVHENLPGQILSKGWIPKKLRIIASWLMKHIEAFAAKRLSAIITTSEKINNRFIKFNSKTITARNYPLLSELSVTSQNDFNKNIEHKDSSNKTIVSLGGINSARCSNEIVQAVGLLSSDLKIKLIIGGACSSNSLFEEIRSLSGWACTSYCGQLPRIEAMALLKKSYIAFIIYSPAPNHYEVRSNRLFESMAAGVPVITSNFPEWREIIEGNKCGLCVDPLNPSEIAKAIDYILTHPEEAQQMGKNGRRAVQERYNWSIEEKKLLALYEKLLHKA